MDTNQSSYCKKVNIYGGKSPWHWFYRHYKKVKDLCGLNTANKVGENVGDVNIVNL